MLIHYRNIAVQASLLLLLNTTNPLFAQDFAEGSSSPQLEKGFKAGLFSYSLSGGLTLSTSGSYIEHELDYDQNRRLMIELGQVTPQFFNIPLKNMNFEAELQNRSSGQLDFEYGYSDHIGLGLTFHHFGVDIERQDLRYTVNLSPAEGGLVRQEYFSPLPEKETLYQGTSALFQLVLHPLSGKTIDPYLAVRAGITAYTGHAHKYLFRDVKRYDTKVKNGMGGVAGIGLGLNIYTTEVLAIRVELNRYRHLLQSNTFRHRGLNSTHFLLGLMLRPE